MTATVSAQNASASTEIYYPDGDGQPMAELDLHREVMIYCIESLQAVYAGRQDVYVAGDNFLYYMRNRPRAVVSLDCYVVFGVGPHLRKSYKVWEENGQMPVVAIEITSDSTRNEDVERKFDLYQDVLGIPEYILFDPTGDYIDVRLTGYRLTPQGYILIERDSNERLYSEQLGLYLFAEGNRLRFFDPASGEILPTHEEVRALAAQETQRAQVEQRRAQEEMVRAEQQAQRAEQQTQRADAEAQRANAIAAELAQTRTQLEDLQRQLQEAILLQRNVDARKDT